MSLSAETLAAEILGTDEVAELLDVQKGTVRKWRTRRPRTVPFPEPAVQLTMGPVWLREDVEKWGLATGRLLLLGTSARPVIATATRSP